MEEINIHKHQVKGVGPGIAAAKRIEQYVIKERRRFGRVGDKDFLDGKAQGDPEVYFQEKYFVFGHNPDGSWLPDRGLIMAKLGSKSTKYFLKGNHGLKILKNLWLDAIFHDIIIVL